MLAAALWPCSCLGSEMREPKTLGQALRYHEPLVGLGCPWFPSLTQQHTPHGAQSREGWHALPCSSPLSSSAPVPQLCPLLGCTCALDTAGHTVGSACQPCGTAAYPLGPKVVPVPTPAAGEWCPMVTVGSCWLGGAWVTPGSSPERVPGPQDPSLPLTV